MSKITNYGLTRSRSVCFIAVPTVGVKGLNLSHLLPQEEGRHRTMWRRDRH